MGFRDDSLLFILGAGASVDAGIKHAMAMTLDIEDKIRSNSKFKKFIELYNYLKSSIIYQRGLGGDFSAQIIAIEELLVVLSEIHHRHRNRLYPFITGWNIHLLKVAGNDFEMITELDEQIRSELFRWINITNYDKAEYFCKFGDLVAELGSAVRVFTLNYDICVEKALNAIDFSIELGFDDERKWQASKFDVDENTDVGLYLYKLHGSIDWVRDSDNGGILTICDNPQLNSELIFGAAAKLSSIDPYLFYIHELRKYSLGEALRVIVVIGYSFSDEYVNSLIGQAINNSKFLKILVVGPISEECQELGSVCKKKEQSRIAAILKVDEDRISVENMIAKDFFESKMKLSYFDKLSSSGDDDPF